MQTGVLRGVSWSAPLREEILQQAHGFDGQDAFDNFQAMVQQVGISEAELTADTAEAQIPGAEDKAGHSGRYQRSAAHHAWLQRRVKGRALEAIIADTGASFADGQHFGMRGGVVSRDRGIAALAYHLSTQHNHRADRDLAG